MGAPSPPATYLIRTTAAPVALLPSAMHGFSAVCAFCSGLIRIGRDPVTRALQPSNCLCLRCGQRYTLPAGDLRALSVSMKLEAKGVTRPRRS